MFILDEELNKYPKCLERYVGSPAFNILVYNVTNQNLDCIVNYRINQQLIASRPVVISVELN